MRSQENQNSHPKTDRKAKDRKAANAGEMPISHAFINAVNLILSNRITSYFPRSSLEAFIIVIHTRLHTRSTRTCSTDTAAPSPTYAIGIHRGRTGGSDDRYTIGQLCL